MTHLVLIDLEGLKKIKNQTLEIQSLDDTKNRKRITVHMGTCGIASGAQDVLNTFKKLVRESKEKDIKIETTGCMGICSKEPLVTVEIINQEPIIYEYVNNEKAMEIFNTHIQEGKVLSKYAFVRGKESEIEERVQNNGAIKDKKFLMIQ